MIEPGEWHSKNVFEGDLRASFKQQQRLDRFKRRALFWCGVILAFGSAVALIYHEWLVAVIHNGF